MDEMRSEREEELLGKISSLRDLIFQYRDLVDTIKEEIESFSSPLPDDEEKEDPMKTIEVEERDARELEE